MGQINLIEIKEIDDFNEAIKQGITLVDFYTTWCYPCKLFTPTFDKLSKEYSNVSFVKINIEEDVVGDELAIKYSISSVPTIILFKQNEILNRWNGLVQYDTLQKIIKENT